MLDADDFFLGDIISDITGISSVNDRILLSFDFDIEFAEESRIKTRVITFN